MAHMNQFHQRWGELVDRKFLHGLTTCEAQEYACLECVLTAADEPFYRHVKALLRATLTPEGR